MVDEKKCLDCAEVIKKDAKVCRYCGYKYSLTALAAQKKQDEQETKAATIGCLVLAIIIAGIYFLYSAGKVDPGETEPIETELADQTIDQSPTAALNPSTKPKHLDEHGETIATALNLNGHLCAKVITVRPLRVRKNTFEVTCVEYRGGSGSVRYVVDLDSGEIIKP